MEDLQLIMYVLLLGVLVMTLMMAWASHRKLKTHQYYLQALIEHEIAEDAYYAPTWDAAVDAAAMANSMPTEDVMVTDAATPTDETMTPAAASWGKLRGSQGEMCNDLRSPIGGKVYNRDCMSAAMVGSSSMKLQPHTAGIPNLNTLIQKFYPKSG